MVTFVTHRGNHGYKEFCKPWLHGSAMLLVAVSALSHQSTRTSICQLQKPQTKQKAPGAQKKQDLQARKNNVCRLLAGWIFKSCGLPCRLAAGKKKHNRKTLRAKKNNWRRHKYTRLGMTPCICQNHLGESNVPNQMLSGHSSELPCSNK